MEDCLHKFIIAGCFFLLFAFPTNAASSGPSSQSLQACARAVNAEHPVAGDVNALSRGVNITTLFNKALAARDVADIPELRKLGIRHVRIPIDPEWVLSWPDGGSADETLRRLDGAVCAALQNGLAVILENSGGQLQPKDGSRKASLKQLGASWDRLAARYMVFTPNVMFFEALNEPAFTDGSRWEQWQRELLTHIRAVAPKHTVLLTASPDRYSRCVDGPDAGRR